MAEPRVDVVQRRPDEAVEEWLARVDPDLVRAALEVDSSLIAETLALGPLARLEACTNATRVLASFRRVPS